MLARLAVISAAATLLLAASSAEAATVTNGNFESGTLTGWTVSTTPGSVGNFAPYSGTTLPISGQTGEAAIGGFGAVADQNMPSSTVLYQDVALEAGSTHTLTFKYWMKNLGTNWMVPAPLSYLYTTPNNQQNVVDVVKAGTDPFSTDPADVLATVYAAKPGDPLATPWTTATVNLSAFAGQNVRLRFVNAGNAGNLFLGLDDVAIKSVDFAPPVISGLLASPSKYKFKSAGTYFRYSSSEAATVNATVSSLTKGKLSGKKCVKSSKKLAAKKNCTRTKLLPGSLTQQAVSGANSIAFDGKLGGKRLPVGKYSFSITLTDPTGNVSPASTTKFSVLPPKKKK